MWATLVRDGHEVLGGALRYRPPGARRWRETPLTAIPEDLDRWHGSFVADRLGRWQYGVVAWVDRVASWKRELARKVEAGQEDLAGELSEGAALLGVPSLTVEQGLAAETGDRSELVIGEQTLELVVDSERATFGSWYELFPRSWGGFAGVEKQLPKLAELGFDVLYLPPVHPIGRTHRKGRNNAPVARRSDPGSPWAIGSELGGHTALHPDLGTAEDFTRLTARAAEPGHRDRARFRAPVLARSPLAARAPGLVPPPAGRHAQVRREPAQALPGHLQRQLRHRGLARALARAARGRAALGVAGRDRVSRGQSAHQAGRLLGVADRRGAARASADGLPGRGVHAPGDDGPAREGRLQPVLHVLHVAQHEGRADAST